MPPYILVSPSSRGISFALTRHLLKTTRLPIVATARTKLDEVHDKLSEDIQGAKDRLHLLELDVTEEDTISAAAQKVKALFPPSKDTYLRLALITPGILHPERSPSAISYSDALSTFRVNTLGPLMMMKYFSSLLPRRRDHPNGLEKEDGVPDSAVWAVMSARVGSIGDNRSGGWYSYRASKAGVNQAMHTFHLHLQQQKYEAGAVTLHPGTCKTDFSKEFWGNVAEGKLFEPEDAAGKLMRVVNSYTEEMGGNFYDWKGDRVQW
ncbi:hypothetical protein YB2330_005342 [Saitoella coloradoensis]